MFRNVGTSICHKKAATKGRKRAHISGYSSFKQKLVHNSLAELPKNESQFPEEEQEELDVRSRPIKSAKLQKK